MIKDFVFKLFFILLSGIFIPVSSGLVSYTISSPLHLISSCIYFIVSWYVTVQAVVFIIARLRSKRSLTRIFLKLFLLCSASFLFAAVGSSLFALIWQKVNGSIVNSNAILNYALQSGIIILFITLVYEVLFLRKEMELDSKILDQLDLDRQQAEMNVLKNELDPHFIFNSLTALSHLLNNNTEKAKLFTQKLAQSYKYFLVNKHHEMIPLEEELRFIDDYFFLLQIRHDDKLKLLVKVDQHRVSKILILPCALQILIENAIKHNQFTEADPLEITISITSTYLKVTNKVKSKPYSVESTNIGLKNLKQRYKITCNKEIVINRFKEKFVVNLPIIQLKNHYEKSHNY